MLKFLKQFIEIITVTLVLIVTVEIVMRQVGYYPAGIRQYSIDFSAKDSTKGFKAYKNASWYFDVTPNGGEVVRKIGTTNADGYRPTIENADCVSCPYILVVGDSLTFGAESSDQETWPEFLARELSKGGKKYKVINISFRGWSTIQEAIALREANLEGKRIDYVLYLPVPNDMIGNIKTIYNLPSPIANYVDGKFSVTLAPPYESFCQMARKFKVEAFARKYSLTTFAFAVAGRKLIGINDPPAPIGTDDGDYKVFWQQGQLDKSRQYIGLLNGQGNDADLAHEAFTFGVRGMAKTSRELGARFIVVPFPFGPYTEGGNADELAKLLGVTSAEVASFLKEWKQYNDALKQIAESNGADFLDINMNLFSGLSYRDYAAAPSDWHFSVKANELLAKEVSKVLSADFFDRDNRKQH